MSEGADSFVGKWLQAEPWHRLLAVFDQPDLRPPRQWLESIGYELRHSALESSDHSVMAAKLGWWREEWRLLVAGRPRHPLTLALQARSHAPLDPGIGDAWIAAAMALAAGDTDASIDARIERWQMFTQVQASAASAWLPDRGSNDPAGHALAFLAERLPAVAGERAQGRLPVPLATLAATGVTRDRLRPHDADGQRALAAYAQELRQRLKTVDLAAIGPYRRGQAALARLQARHGMRRPDHLWHGERVPMRVRATVAVWRAWRG